MRWHHDNLGASSIRKWVPAPSDAAAAEMQIVGAAPYWFSAWEYFRNHNG